MEWWRKFLRWLAERDEWYMIISRSNNGKQLKKSMKFELVHSCFGIYVMVKWGFWIPYAQQKSGIGFQNSGITKIRKEKQKRSSQGFSFIHTFIVSFLLDRFLDRIGMSSMSLDITNFTFSQPLSLRKKKNTKLNLSKENTS